MNPIIIYHSHTGTTRRVAEQVHAACGGRLVEVRPEKRHSAPVAYLSGLVAAFRHRQVPVVPGRIDVSDADILVIGTPVWGRRPTPPVVTAAGALEGSGGKNAVIFATCKGAPGDALEILGGILASRGVKVREGFVFTARDLQDPACIDDLIAEVRAAG
ncbi:MAG: flavodoxin family protein [Methanoculleaceae archaeon]